MAARQVACVRQGARVGFLVEDLDDYLRRQRVPATLPPAERLTWPARHPNRGGA